MSEAQLMSAVIDLARLLGYRVAHFRPAQTAKGWRTPVSADGAGFPDLVLVLPGARLLFVELKSEKGKLSAEQEAWMADLRSVSWDTEEYVWRPADWLSGAIERELRGAA